MKLLCLDGNSILNRAFYGIKLLTTKEGQYTNAIYGFLNILLKLEQDEKPQAVAVAFDLPAPTFRHEMFDAYKAGRRRMPEELAAQMPVLKELLEDLGYQMVTAEGFEADDILGTLAAACEKAGQQCVIATGDRDSYQLVSDEVTVLLTTTRAGRGETNAITPAVLWEKFGLAPQDLIQVKALQGDASDNIPGVPGVGEKTALELIRNFKTVDGVYENLESELIKPGVRQKLIAGHDSALLSLKLARISTDAPILLQPQAYEKQKGNPAAAASLLAKLEMASILQRLNLQADPVPPEKEEAPLKEVAVQPLASLPKAPVCIVPDKEGYLITAGEEVFLAASTEALFLELLCAQQIEKRVFDAKPLYRLALAAGKEAKGIVFDGKLAAYLLNPGASVYTVNGLAAEYAVKPLFSCERGDAAVAPPLFQELEARCKEEEMLPLLQNIEQPLAAVLAQMEETGFLVDAAGIRTFGEMLQKTIAASLTGVYKAVGYEFNLNSPKQLGEALFVKLGLPTRKKTKSGFSTDAETLESLRAYSPVIEDILQYRTYQKLNSTYVEGLLKQVESDGRIHSVFNQTETRTGRISSGEPNLQNIPVRTELGSQMRKFFMASEGCVLLDADYSQIELRILAHVSGDEAMIEAFRTGADIHRSTAARIFGLPPEMVTPQLRSRAKAVNFGIVYGIGAFSLAKDTGVSVKEADRFIKNYLETFSGVRRYMENTIAFGTEKGYVTTLYGRRRALPELRSSNRNIKALGERMAMNTPIQGTAADVIKLAMVRVAARLKKEGLSAKLVLQVHDELIVEAPLAEQKQAAAILGEEMQNAAAFSVPLTAEVNSGDTWYSAKG